MVARMVVRLFTVILVTALPTSSSHRIVAVHAMQPTASGVSMRWRWCIAASMPHRSCCVAGLWTSQGPFQLIFVRIHWLLHSAASIDSTLRPSRCGDIVAAPEEKRRSHSADIAGIPAHYQLPAAHHQLPAAHRQHHQLSNSSSSSATAAVAQQQQ